MLYKNKKKIAYIRYNNRCYEKFIEKVFAYFRKLFAKIIIENIENGIIILVPKYKFCSNIIKKRMLKQIRKYLIQEEINYIVFEKELEHLKKEFNNIKILNGKYCMKSLVLPVLEYILKINKRNINLENVYIFVNQYTRNNIELIEKLARNVKTVNIITENLKYFKKLESFLYNEGILITVSNNKKKSANRAKFIINMDFPKEIFENYVINMDSIIINLTDEKIFFENAFRGIIVNNFKVSINDNILEFYREFYGNIDERIFVESFVIDREFKYVCSVFDSFFGEIVGLIGVRGEIQKCEILQLLG